MRNVTRSLMLAAGLLMALAATASADTAEWIAAVKAVGPKGEGNAAAHRAMERLAQGDTDALLPILRAFDGASPLAANWLRGAFESIADRALRPGGRLPAEMLKAFVTDRDNDPRARQLAYEWLVKFDPGAPDRLLAGMVDDPSPELRRDAVQRVIDAAERLHAAGESDKAKALYEQALGGATDDDQVKAIVRPLRKLGVTVDLPRHFGFLTDWQTIGPFDHRGGKGFDAVYPPEREVDLQVAYPTAHPDADSPVGWKPLATDHEYGIVDINKRLARYKGSCLYFTTGFDSPRRQPVEFRLGTPNAWKLWLNGRLLFAREEYHRGNAMDQYRVRGELQPGRNVILFKICQNEQDEDWAQAYQFQMRIVDPAGNAVLSRSTTETVK